jgi:hypothetical protein
MIFQIGDHGAVGYPQSTMRQSIVNSFDFWQCIRAAFNQHILIMLTSFADCDMHAGYMHILIVHWLQVYWFSFLFIVVLQIVKTGSTKQRCVLSCAPFKYDYWNCIMYSVVDTEIDINPSENHCIQSNCLVLVSCERLKGPLTCSLLPIPTVTKPN